MSSCAAVNCKDGRISDAARCPHSPLRLFLLTTSGDLCTELILIHRGEDLLTGGPESIANRLVGGRAATEEAFIHGRPSENGVVAVSELQTFVFAEADVEEASSTFPGEATDRRTEPCSSHCQPKKPLWANFLCGMHAEFRKRWQTLRMMARRTRVSTLTRASAAPFLPRPGQVGGVAKT
jgi:hypothetical protein